MATPVAASSVIWEEGILISLNFSTTANNIAAEEEEKAVLHNVDVARP